MRLAVLLVGLLLIPAVAAHHPGTTPNAPPTDQFVHRVTDIDSSFAAWEAAWPERVDRMTIGETGVLGLPVYTIRITDESIPFDGANTSTGQKVRIYIDGGHHGNEFLGTDLPMYYMENLLREADSDSVLQAWLETHELYATPLVNAEGNALDTRKNANQVDVNRNYPFAFGGVGSGGNIFDLNYRGTAPLSEPEVRANAEFAASIMPDVWITGHSGISQFLYPWGWVTERSPDDEFFRAMEEPFEAATNGEIDMLMSAELYPAGGATDDWGYGQLGIPTHTYEVDDDQFIPAYADGVPAQIQNQLNGLDFVVKNARLWGAWISLHELDGELHVWNEGWAKAVNVTLEYGGTNMTIPEILPDEMVRVPVVDGTAVVRYKQMIVDAPDAKTRTVSLETATTTAPVNDAQAPGVALLALLGTIAVALAATRRK